MKYWAFSLFSFQPLPSPFNCSRLYSNPYIFCLFISISCDLTFVAWLVTLLHILSWVFHHYNDQRMWLRWTFCSECERCIAILEASISILLHCLETVDAKSAATNDYFFWEVEEGVKCASSLRRIYEEVGDVFIISVSIENLSHFLCLLFYSFLFQKINNRIYWNWNRYIFLGRGSGKRKDGKNTSQLGVHKNTISNLNKRGRRERKREREQD